jgi:hypothetical protein
MTDVVYIISATQAEAKISTVDTESPRFSRLVPVELLVLVAQYLT